MAEIAKSRNGVERAAILLLTLGESEAAEILKHMGAKDVQRLGRSMAELTSVTRDEGRTVLFSSHLLDEVERVSDRVAMLVEGKVVLDGGLDDIKACHHQLTLRFEAPQSRPPALAGALSVAGATRGARLSVLPAAMGSPPYAPGFQPALQ